MSGEKKRWRWIAAPLALLLAFAAPSSAATKIKILQAVDPPANLPFWIAWEQESFAKRGIEAEFVPDDAPGVANRITGDVQFGILGVPAIINAVVQGRDMKMLFPIYAPRSTQVLVARPGIQAPPDLRGKRISVFTVGTGFWIQAMLALEHLGLDAGRDGISFVPVGNLSRQVEAIKTGTIDAATFDPGRARQLKDEGFVVLLDMYPANILSSQSGIAAVGALICEQPQLVKAVVEAYVEATVFSLAPGNRKVAVETLGRHLRLTNADAARNAFRVFSTYVERKPYASFEAMHNMQRIMAMHDARVLDLKVEDAVDDRFVRELDVGGAIDKIYAAFGL